MVISGMKWIGTDIPRAGDIVWVDFNGTDPSIVGIAAPAVPPTQALFQTLTLLNSFTNFGGGFESARYWLDSDGWVNLDGVVARADLAPPQLIATLPVGYRPAVTQIAPVVANNNAARVRIDTNGDIVYDLKSTGATLGFLTLSGIRFQSAAAYSRTQWQSVSALSGFTITSNTGVHRRDDGLFWYQGYIVGSTAPVASILDLTPEERTVRGQFFALSSNNGTNEVITNVLRDHASGKLLYSAGSPGAIVLGQLHYWSDKQDDAWTVLSTSNSWVYFGSDYAQPAYLVDKMGVVHVRGLIKSGTFINTAATLPVGLRPLNGLIFPAATSAAYGRVDVTSAGAIVPQVGSNTYFDLSHIVFRAQQ